MLEKGGYIGVNLSPIFMPAGANKAVEHIVVMLDYLFERFGDDQIGIGTDLTEGHDEAFWTWIMKVNGSGRAVFSAPYKDQEMVLRSVSNYQSIADVLARHGYSDSRIEKIIGRNFVDYMGRVWDESDA